MPINTHLIYPMFALVLLSTFVLVRMFLSRVHAVRSGLMDARYFKTFSQNAPNVLPDSVVKTQNHYSNLFENPTLFYAGCVTAMVVPVHGYVILFWAWFFVLARLIHAFIHIGHNRLQPRMLAFGLSWIALLGLWFTIIIKLIMISEITNPI